MHTRVSLNCVCSSSPLSHAVDVLLFGLFSLAHPSAELSLSVLVSPVPLRRHFFVIPSSCARFYCSLLSACMPMHPHSTQPSFNSIRLPAASSHTSSLPSSLPPFSQLRCVHFGPVVHALLASHRLAAHSTHVSDFHPTKLPKPRKFPRHIRTLCALARTQTNGINYRDPFVSKQPRPTLRWLRPET